MQLSVNVLGLNTEKETETETETERQRERHTHKEIQTRDSNARAISALYSLISSIPQCLTVN